jgi:hypothetical protein
MDENILNKCLQIARNAKEISEIFEKKFQEHRMLMDILCYLLDKFYQGKISINVNEFKLRGHQNLEIFKPENSDIVEISLKLKTTH